MNPTRCASSGCERSTRGVRWCDRHFRWATRRGEATAEDYEARFWSLVDVGDCWEWHGHIGNHGYGMCGQRGQLDRLTHRHVYKLLVGPIPEGYEVDHLCRNPKCCNPDHLEPVPPIVNYRRGMNRSAILARSETCSRGHADWGMDGDYRRCMECRRIARAARTIRDKTNRRQQETAA